jgi:hypothetical protein
MLRLFLAGTVFWMALVLTPRALVENSRVTAQTDQVPVRLLDSGEDCIWCEPYPNIEPVRCTDAPNSDKPMWLNPDEPIEAQPSAPCIEKDGESPTA